MIVGRTASPARAAVWQSGQFAESPPGLGLPFGRPGFAMSAATDIAASESLVK